MGLLLARRRAKARIASRGQEGRAAASAIALNWLAFDAPAPSCKRVRAFLAHNPDFDFSAPDFEAQLARRSVGDELRGALGAFRRTLGAVEQDAARAAGALDERRRAELLVPHQAAIPRGAREARVPDWTDLDENGAPIEGLYAAGADAGGISTGGYSSGLAAGLVFGRIAAEEALG